MWNKNWWRIWNLFLNGVIYFLYLQTTSRGEPSYTKPLGMWDKSIDSQLSYCSKSNFPQQWGTGHRAAANHLGAVENQSGRVDKVLPALRRGTESRRRGTSSREQIHTGGAVTDRLTESWKSVSHTQCPVFKQNHGEFSSLRFFSHVRTRQSHSGLRASGRLDITVCYWVNSNKEGVSQLWI